MDKQKKQNLDLALELEQGGHFSDEKGYWKARGYDEFPGWEHLPFADFFENLSSKSGHKKMWLDSDGRMKPGRLSYSNESLMSLYEGIKDTQQIVVSAGFFIYSALIVNLHMRLAYYSRKLKCQPNVGSVLSKGDEDAITDITYRALALRVAAYLIYEGDGLGGYSDKVWLLWGRIYGMACPDNPEVLSLEEALECQEDWFYANDIEREMMFIEWWKEIDESHASLPEEIIHHIYVGFKLVNRYKQMESPTCPPDYRFNPNSTFDVQAAICGFFRRSAGGLTEARAYDISDASRQPHRFVDMLEDAKGKFLALFLTYQGGLSSFGKYLNGIQELTLRRVDLIEEVIKRQDADQLTYNQYLKDGKVTKVAKRGRIRK